MSPDGTFNRPGAGPANDPDYKTAYAPNVGLTNKLRTNPITNLARDAAYGLGFNTPRLMAQSAEAQQDMRDQRSQFHVGNKPRPTLKRRGGGGSSRIEQQVAAQQMQPEIAPTIGTPPPEEYDFGPAPQGDLTRIQSQAYNEQLSNLMIGGTGSTGYTPQGSPALSPTLKAGQSRGRRRVRLFGGRRRRGGTGDQFSRAGDRIAKLTNLNI